MLLLEKIQNITCLSEEAKQAFKTRKEQINATFSKLTNASQNLQAIQKLRLEMEEYEFEEYFEGLVNKYFPDTGQDYNLVCDDSCSSDDETSDKNAKHFKNIKENVRKLFFVDFLSFCHRYFSTIKYKILKAYNPKDKSIYDYNENKQAFDLTIFDSIDYTDENINYDNEYDPQIDDSYSAWSLYAIKPLDTHFFYLLQRLEQMVTSRTKSTVANLRNCLYNQRGTIIVDVNSDVAVQEFYHVHICILKYSYALPEIDRGIGQVQDSSEMYEYFTNIHDRKTETKINICGKICQLTRTDGGWINSNDGDEWDRINTYRLEKRGLTSCCGNKGEDDLLSWQCKEHAKIISKIKLEFFTGSTTPSLNTFYEDNKEYYNKDFVEQLDTAYTKLEPET
ncbi:hypothetical protein CDIK_1253 [Cucumispora dikerogammari]|nr:hypothetical protein CDIK_1253 [Cucumispora dikerogammari]